MKNDENRVTTILKNMIKTKNCKKIIVLKLTFFLCFAYAGINTCVNAPSAKILRNKFGNLKATKNISLYTFAPKIDAVNRSRKKPNILDTKIPALFVNICFKII